MDNRRIERAELDRPDPLAPEGVAGPAKDWAVDSPEFARQIAAALSLPACYRPASRSIDLGRVLSSR